MADGLIVGEDGRARCAWHRGLPDYRAYHDEEWGRPVGDDRRLFEKIVLEGFQSGLSWLTILRKRAAFRAAFAGFDIARVAAFTEEDVARLLADPGIVRHRAKILSAIGNARRALALARERGSLAAHLWSFAPPVGEAAARPADAASLARRTTTDEATALARDLKGRGWTFVGPTTVYAFMQSVGMVNDHVEGCALREPCAVAQAAFARPAP